MVWFRGRRDDFDGWQVPGWSFVDVAPAFEAIEARLRPMQMRGAHPLSRAFEALFGDAEVSPEEQSAGVLRHNMARSRRVSAARGFFAARAGAVQVRSHAQVDRLLWDRDRAVGAVLVDGSEVRVAKGVILCAGSIASPAILMRSGVGPQGGS